MQNYPIKKLGRYLMFEEIGKGSTGTVYKALDTKDKKFVAIKKISKEQAKSEMEKSEMEKSEMEKSEMEKSEMQKSEMQKSEMEKSEMQKNKMQQNKMEKNKMEKYIENEKMILYFCKEKGYFNIIEILDSFVTKKSHYIVLEYCSYNLLKYVEILKNKSQSQFLKEEDAIEILIQINQAMIRLHENFIYHRDLKPENILIFQKDQNNYIRISDFGFSRVLFKEDLLTTGLGTKGYIAPEIVKGQSYNPKQSDMYSLGVILYQILCNHKIEKEQDFDFSLNPNLSKDMKNLILKMVQRNPQERLKWEDLGYEQALQKNNMTHTQELNSYYLKQWENKINVLNCCLGDIKQTKLKHQDLKNIFDMFEHQILFKKQEEIEKQLKRIENFEPEIKVQKQQQYENDLLEVQNQLNQIIQIQQQGNLEKQDYGKEFEKIIQQKSEEVENLENLNLQQKQNKADDLEEKKQKLDELESLRYKIKFYDDFDNDFLNVFEQEKIRKRYQNKFHELLTNTQNGLENFNYFFKSLQLNNLKQTNQNLSNPINESQVLLQQNS